MDFFAYKKLGSAPKYLKGKWRPSTLERLPKGVFVLSDFNQEKWYYFDVSEEADKSILTKAIDKSSLPYCDSKKDYFQKLNQFKNDFETNGVQKAIFSRVKKVDRIQHKELDDLFENLCAKYKGKAFVYSAFSSDFGYWMGATPEVLITGNTEKLHTVSLAGTKKEKKADWSEKEKEEQALVTEFVRNKISALQPNVLKESKRETFYTGAVYHLRSRFEFKLNATRWKKLIKDLHPTPAVCGLPRTEALKLINIHEQHNRSLYAGLIGFYGENQLDLYVNLRCMQIFDEAFALYIGGGITAQSIIESEWEETENKAKTLISVINQ